MTDNIRSRVREYILTEFLRGESPANLKDDMPLRSSGVLDSLSTLTLVTFVEEAFGIELAAHETGQDTFDTIDQITAVVSSKRRS